MTDADRFHKCMKAEHERKKREQERDAAYVGLMICSLIPSWIVFNLFMNFVYFGIYTLFLLIYVNITGILLVIYTYYYYWRLEE
jgi:hypothetical protein